MSFQTQHKSPVLGAWCNTPHHPPNLKKSPNTTHKQIQKTQEDKNYIYFFILTTSDQNEGNTPFTLPKRPEQSCSFSAFTHSLLHTNQQHVQWKSLAIEHDTPFPCLHHPQLMLEIFLKSVQQLQLSII